MAGRVIDMFCTPLRLKMALLGLQRFAKLSCLPHVLRSRTIKYLNVTVVLLSVARPIVQKGKQCAHGCTMDRCIRMVVDQN